MSTHSFLAASAALLFTLDPGCFSSSTTTAPSPAPTSLPGCDKPMAVLAVCAPSSPGTPCAGLPADLLPGCLGGCMMQTCPTLTCASLPPDLPCGAGCADLKGATFWNTLMDTADGCAKLTAGQPQLGQCTVMVMEQRCPALVGSAWTSKLPGLMK
jgi:hypothetical protein